MHPINGPVNANFIMRFPSVHLGHLFSLRISGDKELTFSITSEILVFSTLSTVLFKISKKLFNISFQLSLDSVTRSSCSSRLAVN